MLREELRIDQPRLALLAGRPSMGKTSFAYSFIKECVEIGEPVLLWSLDMEREGVVQKIQRLGTTFDESLIKFFDLYDPTPRDIFKEMLRLKELYGYRVMVVDYLQLCGTEFRLFDLKAIANGLEIFVLLLSELPREVEYRENKRPDLFFVNDWDYDDVLYLYRDAYYEKDADKNEAELIIAKSKAIKEGTLPLYFDPPSGLFCDYVDGNKNLIEFPPNPPEGFVKRICEKADFNDSADDADDECDYEEEELRQEMWADLYGKALEELHHENYSTAFSHAKAANSYASVEDHKRVEEIYQVCAQVGVPEALLFFGERYYRPYNDSEKGKGFVFYKQLADMRYIPSFIPLGIMYYNGIGCNKSIYKGDKLFFDSMLFSESWIPFEPSFLWKWREETEELIEDYEGLWLSLIGKTVSYELAYKALCCGYYEDADLYLGNMYEEGLYVEPDLQKALILYKRAAREWSMRTLLSECEGEAKFRLGKLLLFRSDITGNIHLAKYALKDALVEYKSWASYDQDRLGILGEVEDTYRKATILAERDDTCYDWGDDPEGYYREWLRTPEKYL